MPDRPSVLLIVVDGLSPDAIDADAMPYLAAVRDKGCQYASAVAAFPSLTRTNAATLATGCLPRRHGIFGNHVWHNTTGQLDTGTTADVHRLISVDAMTMPSLAELLRQAGGSSVVVGNGSAGCTLLLNPESANGHGAAIASVGAVGSPTSGLPTATQEAITQLGAPPESADGSLDWAADAAVACLETLQPDLLTFWSGQPDTVHHHTGPTSAQSRETLRRVDAVIRKLHHAALINRRACNLVVTSDHGFCETSESLDLNGDLEAAAVAAGISQDDIVFTFNSAVVFVYLRDHVEASNRARLAEYLAKQPWAGPVLCNDSYCPDAAFPASWATGGESDFAPDIFVTMATSTPGSPDEGAPARAVHARPKDTNPYAGVHGSLHPADLRIPLILYGPDFVNRTVELTPAGIVDVAPTVHQLLLDAPMPGVDGRVLTEALRWPETGRGKTCSPTEVIQERGRHRMTLHDVGPHRYLSGATRTGGRPA